MYDSPLFAQSNSDTLSGGIGVEQDKLWATFQKTGKVEDYLRYCGIDIYSTGVNRAGDKPKGDTANENHHRRTDREGKQQYR